MTALFDLSGKKALITGGTRGLGRGMAAGLIGAGAEVAIWGISDGVHAIANEMGAIAVQRDVSDREELKTGFGEAVEKLGGLDILIVNHGIQRRHPAEEFPVEDWDAVIEVNLTSMFLLNQLAGRIMLEQGKGKIINVASLLSFIGGITVPAYAAAKGGVSQLTMAFSNEWAGKGINVNAIAPGYVDTDMNEALINDADRNKMIMSRIPAGRWGSPQDMAGAAIFLASDASDFVSGVLLPIDGGWLAR